jgi:hypothetical protein
VKRIFKHLVLLISLVLLSCTDVIEVEVPFAGPRLVIEASLDWEKGTFGNRQTIRLSESIPYFDTTTSDIVTGASVKVISELDGNVVEFIDQNDGNYTTLRFRARTNETYTLEVVYNGETYIAKETLKPVVKIKDVNRSTQNGFDKNAIEVNIYFDDPPEVDNYYLVSFQERGDLFPDLLDISDEFTNGNEITVFYEKIENDRTGETELEPDDIVDIELYGVSETYFNYIRLLIEQNNSNGDPFSTVPAPLKGNCVNLNNPDNFAYGYFRLTQVDRITYVIP